MTKLKAGKKLLKDDIVLLALHGELDAHTADSLEKIFQDIFSAGSCKIILDLHKLSYISSQGISVLLSALLRARDCKGNLVLLRPSPMVRAVLEMVAATEIFSLANNQAAALQTFKGLSGNK